MYRWLARETTTINVEGVFEQIAGKQSIIIKGVGGLAAATLDHYEISSSDGDVDSASVALGVDLQLTALGIFDDDSELAGLSVFWAADPAGVVDIDVLTGLAVSVGTGTVTITAIDLQRVSGTFDLTVTAAELASITLTPVVDTINTSGSPTTTQVTATGLLTDDSPATVATLNNLVWVSSGSDAGIATVSTGGGTTTELVTAGNTPGDVTITATEVSSGVQGSVTLTVN